MVQVEGNVLPEMVLNLFTVNRWVRKSSGGTDFQEERAYGGMRCFLRLRSYSQCSSVSPWLYRHQCVLHRPSLDFHLHRVSCTLPSLMAANALSQASRLAGLKAMFKGMISPPRLL